MKKLSGREKCICAALAAAVTAAVCYSFERTVVHGVLSWTVRQTEYAEMLFELAVLFFLFVLIGRFAKTMRARAIGIGAVAAVFLWIHVILLPVLAAGLYLLWVCLLGNGFRRLLNRTEQRETDIGRDFLAGSLTVICLFCLMSALGIGSIPWLWTAVGITAAVLLLTGLCSGRKSEPRRLWKDGALQESRWSAPQILGTAFVLTVFCMQAGRMNIAIDYDTMWYGARAPYIGRRGLYVFQGLGDSDAAAGDSSVLQFPDRRKLVDGGGGFVDGLACGAVFHEPESGCVSDGIPDDSAGNSEYDAVGEDGHGDAAGAAADDSRNPAGD